MKNTPMPGRFHISIKADVGLVPAYITWMGWRAVGNTADEAAALHAKIKEMEEIGVFGTELEVVSDRVAKFLSENTSLIPLGMGAGKHADAQYLFAEDVYGCGKTRVPGHSKTYRNFAAQFELLQEDRIAAFKEFKADVDARGYSGPEHIGPIEDEEFKAFIGAVERWSTKTNKAGDP